MKTQLLDMIQNLSTTDNTVLGITGVWLVYLFWSRRSSSQRYPTPPGPSPLPLVGNMFQLPQKDEWPIYAAWAKKYGPITYLKMLGTPLIVLNDPKVVRELMDERSANYSDRPLKVIKEMCGLDWVLTFVTAEPHRVRRGMVQRYFSGPASVKHRYHQQEESRILLHNLLTKPDALADNIKQYTSSSILLGAYGYRVSKPDDPLVQEMERSFIYNEYLNGLLAFLIEAFPNAKAYPTLLSLLGIQKQLNAISEVFSECRTAPFLRTKRKIEDGTAAPCFVSTSLDDISSDNLQNTPEAQKREGLVADCASVMYAAATDSSTATLRTFFALMALHPLVVKRAHEDLDRITEGERLPTFEDWDKLPFITAIFLEVLRINTVTPLGLPHGVAKDDVYKGQFIPGGSMIVANIWLFFRDPSIFPEPEKFNPERFMGGDEKAQIARETMNIVWGFGRRSCPGRQLGEASMFITMASVLAAFNVAPKDPNNSTLTFGHGFVRRPILFPISITPRSTKWADIVEKERPTLPA